jgi:hypothetical protein
MKTSVTIITFIRFFRQQRTPHSPLDQRIPFPCEYFFWVIKHTNKAPPKVMQSLKVAIYFVFQPDSWFRLAAGYSILTTRQAFEMAAEEAK